MKDKIDITLRIADVALSLRAQAERAEEVLDRLETTIDSLLLDPATDAGTENGR